MSSYNVSWNNLRGYYSQLPAHTARSYCPKAKTYRGFSEYTRLRPLSLREGYITLSAASAAGVIMSGRKMEQVF